MGSKELKMDLITRHTAPNQSIIDIYHELSGTTEKIIRVLLSNGEYLLHLLLRQATIGY